MSGFEPIKSNNNNRWIQHIVDYAQEKNMNYSCALADPRMRQSYISNKDMKQKTQRRMEKVEREDMGGEDTSLKTKRVKAVKAVKKKFKDMN